jgi:hypothetical protein
VGFVCEDNRPWTSLRGRLSAVQAERRFSTLVEAGFVRPPIRAFSRFTLVSLPFRIECRPT